jgi:hypothetical protein
MRNYAQLTLEPYCHGQALLKIGHLYMESARVEGVHTSTISREEQPNRGL